jgi:hypothetical protein
LNIEIVYLAFIFLIYLKVTLSVKT